MMNYDRFIHSQSIKFVHDLALYWDENHKKMGHFEQKYWKSHKIAHFVTSLWRHREWHEILNTQ